MKIIKKKTKVLPGSYTEVNPCCATMLNFLGRGRER